MWPWGHAAVGYLLYLGWFQLRYREWPSWAGIGAVIASTQIPDLIDKPLAWWLHVLPGGRSLGHSLLFAIPFLVLFRVALSKIDRAELRAPVTLGYLSGIATDLPSSVLRGHFHDATFVLWPLLPLPEYDTEPTFGAHFAQLQISPGLSIELLAAAGVLLVLLYNFVYWRTT